MKILAISNVEGCAERIADAFEDTDMSVIAKEEREDVASIEAKISAAMNKGLYEYAIVAVDDHIGTAIALNKSSDKMRAGVCDDSEDLKLARMNNVNVIIVRASQNRFDYLAKGLVQAVKPEKKEKPRPEKIFEPKKIEEKPRKPDSAQEEEEDYPKGSGKGVFGRLKDHLGIVDDKQ